MSQKEMDTFLRRPLVAVLTTVRPDGTLHSTPVWYEYEDGAFYFWVGADSVKATNLSDNPEASACIATQSEPYQYVSVSGRCEITDREISDRCLSICRRYYEEPRARAFVGADLQTDGSVILTLKPRRLISERSA